MKARDYVRVFPVANSWIVTYRGGQLQRSFDSREQALQFAAEWGKKEHPCTVVVLNREGETEYALTFQGKLRLDRLAIRIVPIHNGWRVARDNGDVLIELPEMEAAKQFAANWSLLHGPCDLSVYDADGKLESLQPLHGPGG